MIDVSEATKTAYTSDSTSKQVTITVPNRNITFTNEDIIENAVELEEAIETATCLTFQGCISSQFKFTVADIITDLRGEYIEVKIQAEDTDEIPLFKGYIQAQNNLNYADVKTEFTAYDILYQKGDIDCGAWYQTLTFPMTVKRFRDAFFTFIGITQENVALVNDSLTMQKTVSADTQINSRYIMQCICQANARYGQIGRDGKFHYRKLEDPTASAGTYPGANTFPSESTYPAKPIGTETIPVGLCKNVDYDPYKTALITKVVVWDEADVVQGSYGSGTNVLKISGNMVAYSVDLDTCARNIYNEVSFITLTSMRMTLRGLPYVECGDIFASATKKNLTSSYVLSRRLKGIHALFDEYTSSLDQYLSDVESLSNQIIKLNGKTNKLTRTVDETRSELTDYEIATDGTIETMQSSITQNAHNITLKVSKGSVSSEISQEAGKITISSNRLIVNSTYFKLSEDGTLKATNGEFTGKITASEGYIGNSVNGFTIGNKAIYNGVSSMAGFGDGVYLGTDGIKVGWGSSGGFRVTRLGAIEIIPVSGNALKIGSNFGFQVDSYGKLQIGGSTGFSASMDDFGLGVGSGSNKTFSVSNSGYTCKIGFITINGSSSSYSITGSVQLELKGGTTSIITGSRTGIHIAKGGPGVVVGSSSSKLYFFGSSSTQGVTRQYVAKASTTADLAAVRTKLNDLITALGKYNLIQT